MKVRALMSFTVEQGKVEAGDVVEMVDRVAEIRIKGGLVEEVRESKKKGEAAEGGDSEKADSKKSSEKATAGGGEKASKG